MSQLPSNARLLLNYARNERNITMFASRSTKSEDTAADALARLDEHYPASSAYDLPSGDVRFRFATRAVGAWEGRFEPADVLSLGTFTVYGDVNLPRTIEFARQWCIRYDQSAVLLFVPDGGDDRLYHLTRAPEWADAYTVLDVGVLLACPLVKAADIDRPTIIDSIRGSMVLVGKTGPM